MTEEPESNAAALERKQKKEKKKQKKRDKAMHVNEENDKGLTDSSFNEERSKKQHKKDKKKKKKRKQKESSETSKAKKPKLEGLVDGVRPFVESSALEFTGIDERPPDQNTTLLLFYQYVEPDWTTEFYKIAKETVERIGNDCGVTGRMRVAREGLNCTLTGTSASIQAFCRALREWQPQVFNATEFKLTHDLPDKQRFPMLKLIPVTELVHYGLEGDKAPPIRNYHGTHLEPSEYHQKLAAEDTVVIDVRNHYEAAIGRFDPPSADGQKWLDPKMRKSTEFPVWLDHPETKEKLKGKQVLMYCTGGIRCERASALLKYRMETDPAVKELGIQGVYQLQGGIDKYFKEFPDGGYWKGKNYVFDKRFAHAPPAIAGEEAKKHEAEEPLSQCEACGKPWDRYRGKRRCPTCGVPSLICKACWQADQDGMRKIDKSIRCDLCVEQNIQSKRDLRTKEQRDLEEYERNLTEKGLLLPKKLEEVPNVAPNPDNVTRLFLKNMCRKNMTEELLLEHLEGITHIVWRIDRKTGQFFGQGWVEMASPEAAACAVAKSGDKVLGRPLFIQFQPPDGKDCWPPPSSAVAP